MRNRVVRAMGAVFLVNIVVKLLGFGREMAIAHRFGANALTDAYGVAYTFPYFLQNVLGYGLVTAVVPLLTRYWQKEQDEEALRLGSSLINVTGLALLAVSLLGVVAAPLLVWLVAPGLESGTAAIATGMTRIMFPGVLFMGSGLVISGILNSKQHFVAAAAAPGVAAIFVILGAFLADSQQITLLAWATLVGFVFFLLIQLPDLRRSGFRYRAIIDLKHPALRGFARNVLPITLGLSVNQIYTIVNRVFASGMAEGSISALNYANRVMMLPLGLFVGAITTALYPTLAAKAQAGERESLAQHSAQGLLLTLACVVPATAGLLVLAQPIIALLFQSGSFDAAATAMTAQALLALAPGLIFYSANMLLIRIYYALGDVKTPIYTGAASILLNVLVSLLLSPLLQQAGLGLANSLAAAAQSLLLFLLLQRRLRLLGRRQLPDLLKIVLGALATALVALLVYGLFPAGGGKSLQALAMVAAIGCGLLAYAAVLLLTRSTLLSELKRQIGS